MGENKKAILVTGGYPLTGALRVQGSKNAVLPILAATLLTTEQCVLNHVPDILDVSTSLAILQELGGQWVREGEKLYIDNRQIVPERLSKTLASKMRSSLLFCGACLSAYGYGRLEKPGGCVIGERPIDMHVEGFLNMGASLEEHDTYAVLKAERLHGYHHQLRLPSVGVTENILLAAVLAKGTTIIEGAAREPEISALCQCLQGAGARIEGAGSSTIVIEGVEKLKGFLFTIPGDRIVAATYICGALATGGKILLQGIDSNQMDSFLSVVEKMGAIVNCHPDAIGVTMGRRPRAIKKLTTGYYPKLPTDVQSLLLVPLCLSDAGGIMEEKIFENRFRIVPELQRMGARLSAVQNTVCYEGVSALRPAKLKGEELRGCAALVLAGLAAKGESSISGIEHLSRGYENMVRDLAFLGARIEWK